jgi:hypothetical protein
MASPTKDNVILHRSRKKRNPKFNGSKKALKS